MAPQDQKGTWVPKGSLGLQVNKGIQDLRVFLVHKVQLVLLVKKDHKENQDLLDFLVLMGLLVILGKKASLEKRVLWVLLVHKVLLATLAPEESREQMVSEVSRDLKVKRVKMVFQDSKVTWV